MGSKQSILLDSDDIMKNNMPSVIPEYVSVKGGINLVDSVAIPLTKEDRLALSDTWRKIKANWTPICKIAFSRWIQSQPEIRTLFKDIPADLPCEDLIYCKSLTKHANMIQKTLDKVLLMMDEMKEFVNSLIYLGRIHYKLGAEHKYTKSLAHALQGAVCESVAIDITEQNAWDSLFRFMLGLLKLGMRSEMKRQNSKNATAVDAKEDEVWLNSQEIGWKNIFSQNHQFK